MIGQLPEFRSDPTGFLLRMYREQGDVARFRLGPQNVVLLSAPDDIRDVLVTNNTRFVKNRMLHRARVLLGEGLLTSEEPYHTRQRKLIQPAFYRERLAEYAAIMSEEATRRSRRWENGAELDLDKEMMRLTLAIVARTLLSADVEGDAGEVGAALTDILDLFDLLMLPLSQWVIRLPLLPAARRFRDARRRLDKVVYRIIEDRHRTPGAQTDLLSLLLAARGEDGTGMSDKEVRDEALTLFLAGHETTANALTWTWYLLTQHRQVEQRFHAEIDTPYVEQVFAEALRLYPPAWAMGRRAIEPHTVRGVKYPPGTIFAISPWVTHRRPDLWPDPERFDPDRFRPGAVEARDKFAYIPFGGGPRSCIGERFAWMEGVRILTAIGSQWSFRLVEGHAVEPRPLLTLRTRNGLRVYSQRREQPIRTAKG